MSAFKVKLYGFNDYPLVSRIIILMFGIFNSQKFVWSKFESSYYPTAKKETYFPSIILHDRKYYLKVVDIPDIPFFSVNSFYSLSDLQGKASPIPNQDVRYLQLMQSIKAFEDIFLIGKGQAESLLQWPWV